MCRPQCLIVLAALSIGVVQSWDLAITFGNKLEFYTNNTKVSNAGNSFSSLTALAYDATHDMLIFVDSQSANASIFSYHIATKKYQSLVGIKANESIQGLAFDPVNSMLFWTDTITRSIYWMSLKPGSNNSAYGNLWIQMNDAIPRDIAVDSCRGYVYWTNTNVTKPSIERARLDGSHREPIVSTDIYMPVSLVIDQRTKRLYWIDDREGIHFSIESSDLDGKNRKKLFAGIHHQPNSLTVSQDSLYWIDWGYKIVWRLAKNATDDACPEEHIHLNSEKPYGIAARYPIRDQVEGIPECKSLSDLSQNVTAINVSLSVPPEMDMFCVHGVKVKSKLVCNCAPGYIGERCDISVCQNYCFQGDCRITHDGQPSCRCKEGYLGGRCEINVCSGFCLNNGICSLNLDKPVCNCATDFEGTRCETVKLVTTTVDPSVKQKVQNETPKTEAKEIAVTDATAICNCGSNTTKSMYAPESMTQNDGDFVMTSCNESWDGIRDPIIMVLGILCGLLVLTCVVLFTKILQLKKRPRIKKRIIVNKNVTPLTARPDQCEITIENCCNMNICETPCFEPRTTIRPSLLDSKPSKEEKKNLIANMEFPEDY